MVALMGAEENWQSECKSDNPERPLSMGQQGIWFAQALDPLNPSYNVAEYLEIFGPIDSALFEMAVRQAVSQTDALHLRFIERKDGLRQYFAYDPNWVMPFIDVTAEADPRTAAESWMWRDVGRIDDLTREPLFTIALFRVTPSRFFYYQRIHHIIGDGASGSIFAERVASLYTALAEGRPMEAVRAGSWFDLLDEEEHYRSSDRCVRDREYWREQLEERPEPVTLSGRLPARSRQFIRCTVEVPGATVGGLRTLGTAQGASLGQVVTAAAAFFLHRLTGQHDLILGMPVSARVKSTTRHIGGMVSNVLPLRIAIKPGDSVDDLVRQVGRRMRGALRHQRYRWEDLRRDLELGPDETAIYGTTVNLISFDYRLSFAGYPTHEHNLSAGPVDDLVIVAYDCLGGADLRIIFNANPDHYTPEELAVHLRRFSGLLHQLAVTASNTPVHRLDLLEAAERRTLLEDFNATARPVPEATLPELFRRRQHERRRRWRWYLARSR